MAKQTIKVEGLRELGVAIRALNIEVRQKIGRAMNNAGAQVVKKAAIGLAPKSEKAHPVGYSKTLVQPGNLKRNIIVKYIKQSRFDAEHIVTVRSGGKNPSRDAFYWRFLEFGTVKVGAKPFMAPAMANNVDAAITAMQTRGKSRIEQAARKAKQASGAKR